MGESEKSKLKVIKIGQNMRIPSCDGSNSQKSNFTVVICKTLKLCDIYLQFSLKNIHWDEFIKISHGYVFSYRSMRNHDQNLTLKLVNFILEELMKIEEVYEINHIFKHELIN